MHERSLVADLVRKVEEAAAGGIVTAVRVRLGKLSHLSPEHLRDHFAVAAADSPVAGGAELVIVDGTDLSDPMATELVLESIEILQGV